ncbi:MAG TPA: helix-turn-helix domain-containing protein [Pseudonocardia sp.]|nr:helix-turn-helix domain-containing protein [Pseudonocardia sp.]
MQSNPGADEVRRLARQLLPRALDIAARITEHVVAEVPELAPAGVPDALRLVRESTDQNIGAMLSTLAFGVTPTTIEPPEGTRDLISNLTAAGGNVTHLLRAYRVGHRLLWQLWSEHVYTAIGSSDDLGAVLRLSSAHLFEFIDQVCQRVVEDVPLPSDPGPTSVATRGRDRREVVRRLLGSGPVDLPDVSSALGYDLGQHHVALLVAPLAEPNSEPSSQPADARGMLDSLITEASTRALAIPSGDGSWWGWLGFRSVPDPDVLASVAAVPATAVLVGMGEPGRGRDGFRRSLTQAREAERVGRLAPTPHPAVVRHRDIEIAALLCADPDRAAALAGARLGGLAGRNETGERLRATVRALLAHGHNRARAAEALHIHHKTVAYRLHQAEELLGRSLTDDTYAIETALLIDLTLHGP